MNSKHTFLPSISDLKALIFCICQITSFSKYFLQSYTQTVVKLLPSSEQQGKNMAV